MISLDWSFLIKISDSGRFSLNVSVLEGLLARPVELFLVTIGCLRTCEVKMLGSHKNIRWIMILAVLAFTVTTVVLGFQHARLNANVQDAREKLDYMESQLEGEIKPRGRRSLVDEDEVS